jgi:hypothetical protein
MRAQTRDEKINFLSAVSSLANTAGGDLIIGMEAVDGLAQCVSGVEIFNLDAEKLRLEQLLASCIEPRSLRNYVRFILSLHLGCPIVIFISLCGVHGCHLRVRTEMGVGHPDCGPLTEDVIPLPEVSIESDTQDVASALQPVFNQIWNAFGFMASTNYDKDGKWIGRSL